MTSYMIILTNPNSDTNQLLQGLGYTLVSNSCFTTTRNIVDIILDIKDIYYYHGTINVRLFRINEEIDVSTSRFE